MAVDECVSRRKHHRSSDNDSGESSKRRRHHHHHHHHYNHHHHSRHRRRKHEIERKEDDSLHFSKPVSQVIDDKEEGEILEEDEPRNITDVEGKIESDMESGEIKQDGVDIFCSHDQEVRFGAKDADERVKIISEGGMDTEPDTDHKNKDELRNKYLLSDNKFKVAATHNTGNSHGKGYINNITNQKLPKGDVKHVDYSSTGTGTEVYNCRDADSEHPERLVAAGSPAASEFLGTLECKERVTSIVSDRNELRGHMESDISKSSTHGGVLSILPEDEAYKSSCVDEIIGRKQSKSHDSEQNDISLPMSGRAALYSSEYDRGKSRSPGSAENSRTDSDQDRLARYITVGRHISRDLVKDVEMDTGRHRVRDRSRTSLYTERPRAHSVKDIHADKNHYREGDKAREIIKEKERSCSFGRNVVRGGERENDREERREKVREREREKVRERESDRNRERLMENDRGRYRDKGRDRERVRDRYKERERERERETYRSGEREGVREKQKEREKERAKNGIYHRYDDFQTDHHEHKQRTKSEAEKGHVNLQEGTDKERYEAQDRDYEKRVVLKLLEQEEEDVERIKEESRKRRQAILEKYKQLQQHAQDQLGRISSDGSRGEKIKGPSREELSPLETEVDNRNNALAGGFGYINGNSDIYTTDSSFFVEKAHLRGESPTSEEASGAGGLGHGTPKGERSSDMFCDDIFGESPAGVRKLGKGDGLRIDRSNLHDDWDDAAGYYNYRIGEVLDGRYEITSPHGRGVFSTVVRAKDLKPGNHDPSVVAVKIIRNNDTMYKAGLEELIILKKLAGADPEDKRHCVRFLSSFKYRNHLCLVFESLSMNLREVLKKFGRNIGLNLTAVRAYAKQLFIALKHLRNCGVLHCDIKPDNMLVNESKNVLKLCDFGNAMFAGKNQITPYLVSRFYRAPEIILGLLYDHPMDMWSIGCCLYELYMGKVLFPGPSNNDMLRLHMELKGSFPKKMLRKGAFVDQHFDQDLVFHAIEEDPVTKKIVKRPFFNIKPKDIGSLITGTAGEDPKMLMNFRDMLERIFVLDPEKRLTVSQALAHPFITGK